MYGSCDGQEHTLLGFTESITEQTFTLAVLEAECCKELPAAHSGGDGSGSSAEMWEQSLRIDVGQCEHASARLRTKMGTRS